MTKRESKKAGQEQADRVRRFVEKYCTYSKGEWAGQPFRLLDWQWEQIIKPLFGTLTPDGLRQYRTVFCEVPKKNGKSEICAAIALYMLTSDGEEGPEVYLAAADREQASLVYQAAAAMVRANPTLSKNVKCLDSRKRMIYAKKNGFLQVLSSESYTKHGLSPSCVIVDEIHAHPSDELWNVLTAGTDYARRQQVVLVITTAGIYDKNSIWWKLRTKAQQVKAGIIHDPRFLPVLYIADPEKDDPADEKLWARVNPSLGQIFTLDKIRQDYEEAKNDPVDFQNFLRFRLNIPIRQLSRWMPMDKWDACADPVDESSLVGRPCCGGIDLAATDDLTAFALVFPPLEPGGIWEVLVKAYCPEEGILKRSYHDRVHYDVWAQQGFITETPGSSTDYEWVKNDIREAMKKFDLITIAFDEWNARQFATDLMTEFNPMGDEHGFQMVVARQGARTLHEPMKSLLTHVINAKVRHGGHPVLRWCADNITVEPDKNGNLSPSKGKSREKIDLLVAVINAWYAAIFRPPLMKSAYEGLTFEQIRERMAI